jgi:chromosome transmission fidelity protein 1
VKVSAAAGAGVTGREYYENTAMRAVNQAIGRSIRHGGDYAVIALLDARYLQPRIRAKLPGWIADRLQADGGANSAAGAWAPAAAGIGAFFRAKKGAGK